MSITYPADRAMPVSNLGADTRAEFITRTYIHLMGAILGFTFIEVLLFKSGLSEKIAGVMLRGSWLIVLGGFIVVSWVARGVAYRSSSLPAQYGALAAFVVAEALIFVPLLYVANAYAPDMIASAAMVTLFGFTGLTAIVFMTRRDFSFLGSILQWCGVVALVLIVASVIFGFHLGTFFSVGMIALAGGAILHDTSNILHRYPEERYVAASLELFASVALMFWYVLRLFLGSRD